MSIAPLLSEIHRDRAGLVPLTLDQYHRMIAEGILEEGAAIELLDGFLVRKDRSKLGSDPMTVGLEHAWVIRTLPLVLAEVVGHGFTVGIQVPITILPDSEPEPDATIARGTPDDYRDHHPSAAELACVIEVADSSLHRDRTTKLRIYADAAVAQYVIINLVEAQVEDYREPAAGSGKFNRSKFLRKGESLELALGDRVLQIPVDRLLP